jgi:hypothetical protein
MVDFGGLADKAKGLIGEHDDAVKQGVEKAGEFVGNKVGHDKVDPVEDKVDALIDKLAAHPAAAVEPPVKQPPAV